MVFNNRGQAAAPFELFVAVIVMGFVIVMGYVVLNTVNTEVCLNSVDKEMSKLKGALEGAVQGGSNSLSFEPPLSCFDSKQTVMKIEIEKDKVCADRCGTMTSECYVMTFANPAVANAFKQKCINLPQYTSFLTEDSCSDASLASTGFTTINPISSSNPYGIRPGQYVVRNVSPAGDAFQKLCIWYKAG